MKFVVCFGLWCVLVLGAAGPAFPVGVSDTLFIGREALLRGRFEQAAQAFADVLAVDPQNPYARTRLALAQGAMGRSDAAVAGLEKALAAREDDLFALWTLGCLELLAGKPEAASGRFSTMVRADPGNVRGQVGLGLAAIQAGRSAEGLGLLGRFQEGDSDDPLAHFLVGLAYWLLDAPANARLELEATLEYEPRNAPALELLGLVYRRQGQAGLARSAWEQALAVDADRPVARFYLSRLAEDEALAARLADRPEEARKAYERALAIDAGNEAAAKALGAPVRPGAVLPPVAPATAGPAAAPEPAGTPASPEKARQDRAAPPKPESPPAPERAGSEASAPSAGKNFPERAAGAPKPFVATPEKAGSPVAASVPAPAVPAAAAPEAASAAFDEAAARAEERGLAKPAGKPQQDKKKQAAQAGKGSKSAVVPDGGAGAGPPVGPAQETHP